MCLIKNKKKHTQNKILNSIIYLKLGQLYTKHDIFWHAILFKTIQKSMDLEETRFVCLLFLNTSLTDKST